MPQNTRQHHLMQNDSPQLASLAARATSTAARGGKTNVQVISLPETETCRRKTRDVQVENTVDVGVQFQLKTDSATISNRLYLEPPLFLV